MKLIILIVFSAVQSLAFATTAQSQLFEKERAEIISGDQYKQPQALGRLAKVGKPAIPTLLEIIALKDFPKQDYGNKMRVVGTLQSILHEPANRSKSTLDELGRLIDAGWETFADSLLGCIAEFKGDPDARKLLISIVSGQGNPQLRGVAIGTLVVFTGNDKSLIPLLKESLLDPSDFLRMRAAGALGVLGSKAGLAPCRALLERQPTDEKVQASIAQAASAAGLIGDPSVLPLLSKIADGKEYGFARSYAAQSINDIEYSGLANDAAKLSYLRVALRRNRNTRWALQRLRALLNDDGAHAKELFSLMRDPAISDESRNEAKTFLVNYGWITQADYWKKPADMVLQPKPLFNFEEKLREQERMALDGAKSH